MLTVCASRWCMLSMAAGPASRPAVRSQITLVFNQESFFSTFSRWMWKWAITSFYTWRSIRFLTGGFQPLKTKTKPVSGWELLFQQTHNSHPLCFGFFFWLTELAWRGKHNRINQIKVKKEKKNRLQICVSEHCFSLFLSIVSLSQIYSVIVWRARPRGN